LFSRAPVVHDVTLAFTIWGFLDERPPAELLERRAELFEGVGNVLHHYAEGRAIADLVPEATLRLTPAAAAAAGGTAPPEPADEDEDTVIDADFEEKK
jgi:hypothetical protein